MRKWIAIVMCVFVMFSGFAACSDADKQKDEEENKVSTNAELIIGKWETNVDLSEMIADIFASDEAMGKFINVSDFKMKFFFTFKENSLMTLEVDEATLSESFDQFFAGIKEGMHDYFETMIQQSELDMTVEELLEKSNMDLDTLVEDMSKAAMEAMKFDEMSYECYYQVRYNRLYSYTSAETRDDEDYIEIEFVDDDTLKFVSVNTKDEGNILNLITELKKVKA